MMMMYANEWMDEENEIGSFGARDSLKRKSVF